MLTLERASSSGPPTAQPFAIFVAVTVNRCSGRTPGLEFAAAGDEVAMN
jgi:hypothetical protein